MATTETVYPPTGLVEQSPGQWSYGITWHTWGGSRTVSANLRHSPLEAYEAALNHAIRLGWRPRRWWQWWRRKEIEPSPPVDAAPVYHLTGQDTPVTRLTTGCSPVARGTLH